MVFNNWGPGLLVLLRNLDDENFFRLRRLVECSVSLWVAD